jgi:hypothetical protein
MSHHFVSIKQLPAGGEKLSLSSFKLHSLFGLVAALGFILSLVLLLVPGVRDIALSTLGYDNAEQHVKVGEAYAYSWLFAFFFCFTIAMGGCFWVLLHNASNSAWGVVIRRLAENLGSTLMFLFFMGLPILVPSVRDTLYDWAKELTAAKLAGGENMDAAVKAHAGGLLQHKFPFLNHPFWTLRYFAFFIVMISGIGCLRGWSVSQDTTGDIRNTLKARRFSSGWLPLFALSITFAGIDWVKSLNYTWPSTMWGVNVFASSAWSSMAVLIITVITLHERGYLKKIVTPEHLHLMGKLQFAFTVFWAYITFSQYMLIWYANIAEETQFYAIRNTGGWRWIAVLMVLGHFFIPFLLLIIRNNKKNPARVKKICFWILGMHALELYWWVIPMRGPKLADKATWAPGILLDVLAFVTVVSGFIWFFQRMLSKSSLYPVGDPRLQESINVAN